MMLTGKQATDERKSVAIVASGAIRDAYVDAYARSGKVGTALVFPGSHDMTSFPREHMHGMMVASFPGTGVNDAEAIAQICRDVGVAFVDVVHKGAVECNLPGELRDRGIKCTGPGHEALGLKERKMEVREFISDIGLSNYLPEARLFGGREDTIAYLEGISNMQPMLVKTKGSETVFASNASDAIRIVNDSNARDAGKDCKFLIEELQTHGRKIRAIAFSDGRYNTIMGYTDASGHVAIPRRAMDRAGTEIEMIVDTVFEKLKSPNSTLGGRHVNTLGAEFFVGNDNRTIKILRFRAIPKSISLAILVSGLDTNFFDLGESMANGSLADMHVHMDGKETVAITCSAREAAPKEAQVFGIWDAMRIHGISVYDAGGISVRNGMFYAKGGDLLHVIGKGDDVAAAMENARAAASLISTEGGLLYSCGEAKSASIKDVHRE